MDLISVVNLKDEDEERNCEDTIRAHKITFPVLRDEDRRVSGLFKVVSTPTLVIVRPDGIVDSVYTSGKANYLPIFKARVKAVMGNS